MNYRFVARQLGLLMVVMSVALAAAMIYELILVWGGDTDEGEAMAARALGISTAIAATLGGTIEVPTVGGEKADVKIGAGTPTGKRFKIPGKGMPVLNRGTYGDMVIEAMVETPVNLNKKQKELLRAFAEECGDDVSPEASGFFNKVKELWEDLTD